MIKSFFADRTEATVIPGAAQRRPGIQDFLGAPGFRGSAMFSQVHDSAPDLRSDNCWNSVELARSARNDEGRIPLP